MSRPVTYGLSNGRIVLELVETNSEQPSTESTNHIGHTARKVRDCRGSNITSASATHLHVDSSTTVMGGNSKTSPHKSIEVTDSAVASTVPNVDKDSSMTMLSLEDESNSLWKRHRYVAAATLTIPLWLSLCLLIVAFVYGGGILVRNLVFAATTSIVAGRFIIWGGESSSQTIPFSPAELALLVFYLDIMWAIVLTWHAGFLFHVPWIGVRLESAVCEGSRLLRSNRWMRRLTVFGLVAFVMLPISSTGSIGGSLLGRLLGLSRGETLLTVVIGSVLGGAVMLLGAEFLRPWLQDVNPLVRYGGIGVIIVICFLLTRRYRRSMMD